eukprot:s2682_g6.t1
MISAAWVWAANTNNLRRSPVHGEEEAKLVLSDSFEAQDLTSHETSMTGAMDVEETMRAYRQMLYETDGLNNYLCAAILDPETIYQKDDKGVLFPEALSARGIVPGVKPHLKVYELPGTNGDTVMQAFRGRFRVLGLRVRS